MVLHQDKSSEFYERPQRTKGWFLPIESGTRSDGFTPLQVDRPGQMTTVRVDCPAASTEPAPGPTVVETVRAQPLRDRPRPVEREREFGLDEMFFSTTDSKGRITSGNRVFERVSGYAGSEMRGQPHNMIRHPDMPRSVFQLLWDYLGAGRPIAAYVKNLASDGAYYWVLATALPVPGGYVSIRIKPSTPSLGVIEGAYRELLALERSLEGEGATRRQAIEASAARLNDLVVEAGFKDYAGFMGAALAAELASREAARSDVPRNAARRSSDGPTELARILHGCSAVDRHMRSLFDALEGFARLNETLAGKAGFVRDLADSVRLLALNAMVSSARLERDGDVLGAVAGMLGMRSNAIAGVVERVAIDPDEVFELLSGLEFRISLATLQTEMTACFARELRDAGATATAVAGPGVANDLAARSLSSCGRGRRVRLASVPRGGPGPGWHARTPPDERAQGPWRPPDGGSDRGDPHRRRILRPPLPGGRRSGRRRASRTCRGGTDRQGIPRRCSLPRRARSAEASHRDRGERDPARVGSRPGEHLPDRRRLGVRAPAGRTPARGAGDYVPASSQAQSPPSQPEPIG